MYRMPGQGEHGGEGMGIDDVDQRLTGNASLKMQPFHPVHIQFSVRNVLDINV